MSNDPLKRYQSLMNNTHAPDKLPQLVIENIHNQKGSCTNNKHKYADITGGKTSLFSRTSIKGFAIAACTMLAIGAGLLATGTLGLLPANNEANESDSPVSSPFNFVVQAYADTTDSLLSFGENGMIVFDRNMDAGLPLKETGDYQKEGYYTGCMFQVNADAVTNVTASIDRGQLYRYTSEEFVKSKDPERWKDALSWKPQNKDQDAYYSGYGYVQPQEANDGLDRSDQNKLCRVALSKLLGSKASFDINQKAGEKTTDYNIGLWTNADYTDPQPGYSPFDSVIDTFDGAHLTIAITFNDGSTSTKVIELRSADMKAKLVPAIYGGSNALKILPEIVDENQREAISKEGYSTERSLFGTVIDESFSPAPSNTKN